MQYQTTLLTIAVQLSLIFSSPISSLIAQENAGDDSTAQTVDEPDDAEDQVSAAPEEVDIDPLADDSQIEVRLTNILEATTWFDAPQVDVDQGVVFLQGVTKKEEYRSWAGDLARNTQDVVAVVNRIKVAERSVWDLSPAWAELRKLGRETVQMLPLIGVAVVLVVLSVFAASGATQLSRWLLGRRMSNRLLISVTSRAVAIPVFLIGLYLALRVSGLTQMAATVLGGTGLIGLVLGIAFRDIAENFLASVLISVQRPFATGDLIEVQGHFGIVQSVTVRGTLLMTLDGNHVQIPNASIYKSIIRNVTANPNLRSEFVVGIDYGDSIAEAQSIIFRVLREHEAVLDSPDPMVLVDELGASTVNLRIYFWLDGHKHSLLKVRSSLIRLVKMAIEDGGLTMPDESREVIFPRGVPVRMLDGSQSKASAQEIHRSRPTAASADDRKTVTAAENELTSDNASLEEQARKARSPETGTNLLADDGTG